MLNAEGHDDSAEGDVAIPQSFLDMPRWWTGGQDWLAKLPAMIRQQCATWDLSMSGPLVHGSNAVVVPVHRRDERFALRMTLPDPDLAAEVRALQFWDGRGTVRLFDADPDHGAMLLELLDSRDSLAHRPVAEAVAELGRVMRRLAVPAPADVTSTATIAARGSADFEPRWRALHEPFDKGVLAEAADVGAGLSASASDRAVNGDLHSAQVLRGSREPWLTVDPVLLRGDIEYDLARILWTRIDEMPGNSAITGHFDTVVQEAGLDRDRARDWVLFRTVDYWLWGLSAGLTEDPPRCQRLATAFLV